MPLTCKPGDKMRVFDDPTGAWADGTVRERRFLCNFKGSAVELCDVAVDCADGSHLDHVPVCVVDGSVCLVGSDWELDAPLAPEEALDMKWVGPWEGDTLPKGLEEALPRCEWGADSVVAVLGDKEPEAPFDTKAVVREAAAHGTLCVGMFCLGEAFDTDRLARLEASGHSAAELASRAAALVDREAALALAVDALCAAAQELDPTG